MTEMRPAEAKVMRAIVAREHRRAGAERREAQEAFERRRAEQLDDELKRRRGMQAPLLAEAAKQDAPRRTTSNDRERQRVEHLVLGRDRPPGKSVGRGRAKKKIAVSLDPSIDAALTLREAYGGRQGTPETRARIEQTRAGSLARLQATGAIDAEQMAAAEAIAAVYELIGADVTVRTASLETRVDVTRRGDGSFFEKLARVRCEVAYGRWREQVDGPIAAVLDMIVGDEGVTVVARRYRMHNRRAKKLLVDALDLWPRVLGTVAKEIDGATLAAAQAGILA